MNGSSLRRRFEWRMGCARKRVSFAFCVAALSLAPAASSAPVPTAWSLWAAHDADSTESIDHGEWDAFLKTHVIASQDGIHRVAYAAVTAEDRAAIDQYLARLTSVSISTHRRAEQQAFWINLYNALTLRVVLDHYPVSSIREIDISPGWFSVGPWKKKLIAIEGTSLSLDDIEHRILRPLWRDPRIHYAVNCASIGCPNLQRKAFTAENMEALLDLAARAYVNHPRGLAWEDEEWVASKIYDWFEVDFGSGDEGLIAHLLRYAEPDLAKRLRAAPRIGAYGYDWVLNDAAPAR